jgi:GNAT superfamily N-acetyltransferase
MRSTLVVRVPIVEVSAKIRTGPPLDGPELLSDDCWAGELPLRLAPLSPKDDERLGPGVSLSEAVERRARTLAPSPFQHDERRRGDVVVTTDPGRIDFAFVHRFLSEESYWARGIEPSELRIALRHSLLFGLFRGDKQIGFARVVTDMARFAYLGDVFVEPDARGQGLGTWLVASVLDHPDLRTVDRWVLLTQDAHGLYARFGFEPAEAGRTMVRESSRGDPSGA